MKESTQSTELSKKENIIFINNLIEMTRKKDMELKNFIDYYLHPKESPLSIDAINNNIETLKKMDRVQQSIIKARAKEFEKLNNPAKYFPTIIAIFGFVLSLYALFREIDKVLGLFLSFIVTSIITIYVVVLFKKIIKNFSTAVFFNSLIDSIDFEK